MPTFEQMKKLKNPSPIGHQIKEMSNMVFDETFSNSTTYRKGMIYDAYMKEIEEVEFKFIKVKTYTIDKDQVEYWVQFKTGINPEIMYDTSLDKKHRLSYYIDVLDDNSGEVEKWLIVGKDVSEFDRYNVLKCNWEFEWIDAERQYYKCLGVVRDSRNYNSGIWNNGFYTTIENQTMFIVPTNTETMTLDYNIRVMITDNMLHPKTYEIAKLMDTFPLGCTKVTLTQVHYNQHTDLCGTGDFEDNKVHMVCDYYKSELKPIKPEDKPNIPDDQLKWTLSGANDKLYVDGQPQIITAVPNIEYHSSICEWHIFIDNTEYTDRLNELEGYFDIIIDNENNTFSISAINKDMVNYIVKVAVYDKDRYYYDSVEMEVCL